MAHLVPSEFLQEWFNALQVEALFARGLFRPQIVKDWDASGGSGEPPGTRSQMVRLYAPGDYRVCDFHRYLRPDGSIGASGLLDPKGLSLGGEWYYCL